MIGYFTNDKDVSKFNEIIAKGNLSKDDILEALGLILATCNKGSIVAQLYDIMETGIKEILAGKILVAPKEKNEIGFWKNDAECDGDKGFWEGSLFKSNGKNREWNYYEKQEGSPEILIRFDFKNLRYETGWNTETRVPYGSTYATLEPAGEYLEEVDADFDMTILDEDEKAISIPMAATIFNTTEEAIKKAINEATDEFYSYLRDYIEEHN